MSFIHAEKMHNELAEQGIFGGDCIATSLDSFLVNRDLPDGFYYELVAARESQDEDNFERLIRQQVAKNFRNNHQAFTSLFELSVYCAPDGNPLEWDSPSDRYEVVPIELVPLIKDLPNKEWGRVYGITFDDETETERRKRADSACEDAYERLGMFVVARNMILDGVSLMPMGLQGDAHVFAVTQNGLDDIHVVDTIVDPEDETNGYNRLVRSPHLPLEWLCNIEGFFEESPNVLNMFGDPHVRITDTNIPIIGQNNWKYAVYPVPPQK
jgi:hypothetical protein